MKKIAIILIIASFATTNTYAQKYFSKTGEISFYSSTPIEDIQAVSNSASTVYDGESGKIQWAVLIKSFEFEKALMQEHFNENYMESSTYPKAVFKGSVEDPSSINLATDGEYTTQINGSMTIHGVKKPMDIAATFKVVKGVISATSKFKITVANFGIEIPSVVSDNIAKELEVKVKTSYAVLKKS